MDKSDIMKEYMELIGTKSGFMMTGGKCVYLYNKVCCEAKCRRILLRSDGDEVFAEYAEGLFVSRCGAKFTAYRNSRRLLGVRECIVLYEVPLEIDPLYGVFSGGTELTLADAHFTDSRIAELIDSLLVGDHYTETVVKEEFKALEEAVRTGEISALNKIYLMYGGTK